jgi:hypothetical protein
LFSRKLYVTYAYTDFDLQLIMERRFLSNKKTLSWADKCLFLVVNNNKNDVI